MTIFLHLLLAHFIADYPFQPGWLVAMKKRGIVGILIHTSVHLVTSLVLAWPWLEHSAAWWALGVIFVTHNIIDITKVRLDKKHPQWRLGLYLADQIAHVTVIVLVSLLWLRGFPLPADFFIQGFGEMMLVPFLLILTLATYVTDVSIWFIRNEEVPYRRNYRMMLKNALVVLTAFAVYWTLGAYAVPAQSVI